MESLEERMLMEGSAQPETGLEHLCGGGEGRVLDHSTLVWPLPHSSKTLLASSGRLLMRQL